MKFWKNCKKILKKFKGNREEILNDSRKIMKTLLEKTEIIRNWYWYYKEQLESFSKVISMKSEKNYKKS